MGKSMQVLRGLILAVGIGYTSMTIHNQQFSIFFILLSLYLLNMRFRQGCKSQRIRGLSLMAEVAWIFLLNSHVGGMTHLFCYITLMDGIHDFPSFRTGISAALFLFQGLCIRDLSRAEIFLNSFCYLSFVVFTTTLRQVSGKINELGQLYDDGRKYSYELENAKDQIEQYSKRVEALAQLEERSRISEEIHDTIGHRLTATLLQMEAGLRLGEMDPQKGKELLMDTRDHLRESIDVLRETVRGMKPKGYRNPLFTLQDMIEEFKKKTAVDITLRVHGEIMKLYPSLELICYKNIQEALTNAVRHGQAKHIQILLIYGEEEIRLQVKDDGRGCEAVEKGMGLRAMEERLKLVGGCLKIYHEGGFCIESIIPNQQKSWIEEGITG